MAPCGALLGIIHRRDLRPRALALGYHLAPLRGLSANWRENLGCRAHALHSFGPRRGPQARQPHAKVRKTLNEAAIPLKIKERSDRNDSRTPDARRKR